MSVQRRSGSLRIVEIDYEGLRKVREDCHALVLMIRTVRATLRVYEGIGDLTNRPRLAVAIADSPTYSRACHSW